MELIQNNGHGHLHHIQINERQSPCPCLLYTSYAENGPGADEYRQYYEEMDPTTAEALYKQVIQTEAADKQMQEYANTFSNMQASEAAAILGNMTDNLDLAASILKNLDVSTRGAILGAMDSAIAARIVKIMDPNSCLLYTSRCV